MSNEYKTLVCRMYSDHQIGLGKLAELLETTIEEAKQELRKRSIPLDLGVDSLEELLEDIENA